MTEFWIGVVCGAAGAAVVAAIMFNLMLNSRF